MSNDRLAATHRRVVWKEGTFLRPQHFQQQDRYFESLVQTRAGHLRPFAWGLHELRYDRNFLAQGKLRITVCRGILEDGTPFDIPDDDDEPQILEVPPETKEALVYLTLPARRDGAAAFAASDDPQLPVRYIAGETEVSDNNADTRASARVLTARQRLHLRLAGEDLSAFVALPLLRVQEVRSDKTLVINETFIPPCLDCRAAPRLHGFVKELHGLLQHRAEALAGRLVGGGGSAEIADLLLLQAVNQFEPLLGHLSELADLHPEDFFRVGLQTAGVLATFSSKARRPAAIPAYRHHDLQTCFEALMAALRGYLSMVIERNVIPIPLKEVGHGVRVGVPPDRELLDSALFVLAAKANMNGDALRQSFPANVKIGPVERIAQLVNLQLKGVPIRPLAVAPRQLPYHQGFAYFELDKSSEIWGTLKKSGGIGFFAGSGYPGLELALWAIRSD